jgi:hypothetical protein
MTTKSAGFHHFTGALIITWITETGVDLILAVQPMISWSAIALVVA